MRSALLALVLVACNAPEISLPAASPVRVDVRPTADLPNALALAERHQRYNADPPVVCDLYCEAKHTLLEAQALGLASGCTSVGPPDRPLAIATLPPGSTCPVRSGYLCSACVAVEKALAAIPPDMAVSPVKKVGDPVVYTGVPYVGVKIFGGELWGNDADQQAWKMVGGVMETQGKLPDGWPTE